MSALLRREISDFCTTGSGGTPLRTRSSFYDAGTIPWIKSGELKSRFVTRAEEFITEEAVQSSSAKLVPQGALLVAMYGATVGDVAQLAIPATTNQAICHILPDPKVCDADYLFHFLRASKEQLLDRRVGGGQPNISQAILRSLEVPLPPLAEQRRIAAILDKADALRAKRREAIAKLDQLLQSVFLDMFGDPVGNPRSWPVVKVGDVFSEFVGGKNVSCPDESASPYRILKVSAVTSKVYRPEESKPAPERFLPQPEAIVEEGDLLFSRANTTELVAATAYVWKTPEKMVLPDKLWKMRVADKTRANVLFVWELFKNASFRHELSKRSSGTSGSMKNIAKSKLVNVPMPLPPISLQDRFAEMTEVVERQKRMLHAHAAEQEALFASLQHRAFTGTL